MSQKRTSIHQWGCPSSNMAPFYCWLAHPSKKRASYYAYQSSDVELEAGAIADRLVKTNGPAVLSENWRRQNEISEIPLQ